MELGPHVEGLHRALASAGAAGGEAVQDFLDRFTVSLDSAIRLSMLQVLAAAAEEIATELSPGSVEVRLRGGEPQFVVVPPGSGEPGGAARAQAPPRETEEPPAGAATDGGASARISLRLSESLKAAVEAAAAREGLSVNTWVIRVLAAAVGDGHRHHQGFTIGQSYTGWAR